MRIDVTKQEDFKILKIGNNPLSDYCYFLCIEDARDTSDYVALGFKNCKVLDMELNDIKNKNFFDDSFKKHNISIVKLDFSDGFSHDSDLIRFLNEFTNKELKNKKILIFETKKLIDMFDGTLKNKSDYSKIISRIWAVDCVMPGDWEISGFDAMTYEILIKNVSVRINNMVSVEMETQQINNKIMKIISKLY